MTSSRFATSVDYTAIYALYKKVAAVRSGLARTEEEITPDYIHHIMHHSATLGYELVVDHPEAAGEVIAEIHCYQTGLEMFSHLLGDLTVAVSPDFQGQGLGKLLFTHLLSIVTGTRPDILRVELLAQESNKKAIGLYQKLGFVIEGCFPKRIKVNATTLEDDIQLVWTNPNFQLIP